VAFRDEELSLSWLREDGLWLDRNVVEAEGTAHSGQVVGKIMLRLESYNAALSAPMSKPEKKAALVRSDVTNGRVMSDVAPDFRKFCSVVAVTRSQGAPNKSGSF
jgi:hypothetical protein